MASRKPSKALRRSPQGDPDTWPTGHASAELLDLATLGARAAGAVGSEIDEVAQNAAIKLLQRWDQPSVQRARKAGAASWRSYVFVVSRRSLLDQRRSKARALARERAATLGHSGEPLEDRPNVIRRPVTDSTLTADEQARIDLAEAIRSAGLTPRQREVAALTLIEDLSTHEIAERSDVTVRSVQSALRSALEKLRFYVVDDQRTDDSATGEALAVTTHPTVQQSETALDFGAASTAVPISAQDPPPALVVIDDEPVFATAIDAHLRDGAAPEATVTGLDRPRRLRAPSSPETVTHAVVDLSFGRYDMDGPRLVPELETGSDALDLLRQINPTCRIVVATRNDTELETEMIVAIRQTWPDVVFFHKSDPQLLDRVAAFVTGKHYQDSAEIALDLIGVDPVHVVRLQFAVEATGRPRPVARLVRVLADFTETPSREDVASRLDVGGLYVRSLAHDFTYELAHFGLLRGDRGGLEALWRWSRARRAIVQRAFADLLGDEPRHGTAPGNAIRPLTEEDIRDVVAATVRSRPIARLLLTLTDFTDLPTREEVATRLDVGTLYVRALSHELHTALRSQGLLREHQRGGLKALWQFSQDQKATIRSTFSEHQRLETGSDLVQ